jgi:glutamine synthetase
VWHDESPVVASPRQILRGQLDRLAERGWSALAATELEFIVFRDTYEEAFDKGYKDLVPGNQYNVDYSILGTSRLEPLLGRIRRQMAEAGLEVENSKGECNFGQHEINFTYEDALGAADTHVIYKNGAKEIASQEGMAITFMAKYDEREGNSCHVHLSLRGDGDTPVFADQPEVFDQFLAGQLACMRDLTLFLKSLILVVKSREVNLDRVIGKSVFGTDFIGNYSFGVKSWLQCRRSLARVESTRAEAGRY